MGPLRRRTSASPRAGTLPGEPGVPGRAGSSPAVHFALFLATAFTLATSWSLLWRATLGVPGIGPLFGAFVYFEQGLTFAASVLAILGAHEAGHYLACRRYGVAATLPYFIPAPIVGTFGAVIRVRGPIPDRRALFDIAIAGPVAGFVVTVPIFVHGLVTAERVASAASVAVAPGSAMGRSLLRVVLGAWLDLPHGSIRPGPTYMAAWLGILVTALNLFPAGQLDGGHIAFALGKRVHRLAGRAVVALLLAIAVWHVVPPFSFPPYLLWLGIVLWMRRRHASVLRPEIPLGRARVAGAVGAGLLFLLTFMPFPIE